MIKITLKAIGQRSIDKGRKIRIHEAIDRIHKMKDRWKKIFRNA